VVVRVNPALRLKAKCVGGNSFDRPAIAKNSRLQRLLPAVSVRTWPCSCELRTTGPIDISSSYYRSLSAIDADQNFHGQLKEGQSNSGIAP
jgi:hypothetical protein